MIQPNPFETEAPDFRAAYLRLASKIYRTGLYYRLASSNWRAKHASTGDPSADKIAESLVRCASDMDFIFDRAAHILPHDVIQEIRDSNPTPFSRDNKENAA